MRPQDSLQILYRDDFIAAIQKPPGLLVHLTAIDRMESRSAMTLLRDQLGQRVYPVHRIDKPVSGVLLFALNRDTARKLTQAFASNSPIKTYQALVRGHCEPQGIIDYALKEQLDPLTDLRADPNKPAKPAVTEYRRLKTFELPIPVGRYPTARYSLMEIQPKTGRKHQIRRHMKHIFHPIVGDTTHGDGHHNRLFRENFGLYALMLASIRLEIVHPETGAPIQITSEPATPVQAGLEALMDARAPEAKAGFQAPWPLS